MAWTPKFTFSVTWDNITGKPLNYPTTWSMVGGKPSTFPSTWATVSGKPATATRWPTWGEVTGKPNIPQGTVTSVSAGAGMSFSTITGSGAIALGSPSQVNTTSTSTVTGESHSHSFSSLFSDSTSFTADNPPEDYPSSVVSLSRVGSLAGTGWPTNGVAANFMAYGSRYGQLYFSSNTNQMWFRTAGSEWRDFEEVYHTGNDGAGSGLDADYLRGMWPDAGDAADTIARRDENGDLYARIFRSTFPSQSDLSSSASIAFRINDSNQNYIRFTNSPSALRNWLELGSAATSNISDFASSSDFTRVGAVSGGTYYDYLPSNRGLSYFFHAAGNSPSDAPASPARQTAVLGMDTSWGTTQLAITNENDPQVFVRGNGATPWNRVWTAGDFDPSTKADDNAVVKTSGNQSNLSGNKTWTGNHIFIGDMIARSGSASSQMTVQRTGNSINAAIAYTTTGGTIYAGQGDNGYFNWGSGTDIRLSNGNSWGRIGSSGLEIKGTISDSIGNVRKPEFRTANGTITLTSGDVNRIVEKSNNSSYTYTIPSGHGSHGDIITFVNSGTSGTLTINAATGVTIYRNGTAGNISVGPGSTVTVYRSATANRWIA